MHLPASQRSLLYKLFRQYEQLKRQNGEWDAADRTFYVYDRLRAAKGLPPRCTFHFVYVDEVTMTLLDCDRCFECSSSHYRPCLHLPLPLSHLF